MAPAQGGLETFVRVERLLIGHIVKSPYDLWLIPMVAPTSTKTTAGSAFVHKRRNGNVRLK
jgi:hypothetical protein